MILTIALPHWQSVSLLSPSPNYRMRNPLKSLENTTAQRANLPPKSSNLLCQVYYTG